MNYQITQPILAYWSNSGGLEFWENISKEEVFKILSMENWEDFFSIFKEMSANVVARVVELSDTDKDCYKKRDQLLEVTLNWDYSSGRDFSNSVSLWFLYGMNELTWVQDKNEDELVLAFKKWDFKILEEWYLKLYKEYILGDDNEKKQEKTLLTMYNLVNSCLSLFREVTMDDLQVRWIHEWILKLEKYFSYLLTKINESWKDWENKKADLVWEILFSVRLMKVFSHQSLLSDFQYQSINEEFIDYIQEIWNIKNQFKNWNNESLIDQYHLDFIENKAGLEYLSLKNSRKLEENQYINEIVKSKDFYIEELYDLFHKISNKSGRNFEKNKSIDILLHEFIWLLEDNDKDINILFNIVAVILMYSWDANEEILQNFQLKINEITSWNSRFMRWDLSLFVKSNTLHFSELENSTTDPLTGAYNRRKFEWDLSNFVNSSARSNDYFWVLSLDIDNFKYINDNYGHSMWDSVLQCLVTLINENIRPGDNLYRNWWEEFIVTFQTRNQDGAKIFSEKIIQLIEKSLVVELFKDGTKYIPSDYDNFTNITISGWLAQVTAFDIWNMSEDQKKKFQESIVSNSDIALYSAKNSGKNQVVVFK